MINQLWNDEAVRAFARSLSPVLRLPETTEYIFQNIHRIAATDYRPTEEDRVLFPRFPPGVSETSICVNSVTFRYFNVCGQRGERRKWIHIFEGVTAVVFCVDLTTYNKVDEYEVPLLLLWGPLLLFSFKFDGVFPFVAQTNEMQQVRQEFDSVCNSRYFQNTSILLVFTNTDSFESMLLKEPLSRCFVEFDGGASAEMATEFVENRFSELNQSPETKSIYPIFVPDNNFDGIFRAMHSALTDIIVRAARKAVGLA